MSVCLSGGERNQSAATEGTRRGEREATSLSLGNTATPCASSSAGRGLPPQPCSSRAYDTPMEDGYRLSQNGSSQVSKRLLPPYPPLSL